MRAILPHAHLLIKTAMLMQGAQQSPPLNFQPQAANEAMAFQSVLCKSKTFLK